MVERQASKVEQKQNQTRAKHKIEIMQIDILLRLCTTISKRKFVRSSIEGCNGQQQKLRRIVRITTTRKYIKT